MRSITKRSAAVVSAAVLGVGAAGGAWAAGWFVKGKGTATAATASISDLSATVTITDKLYPGRHITAIAKVDNPNEFPVLVNDITDVSLTATKDGVGYLLCTLQNSKIHPTFPDSATISPGAVGQQVEIPVEMGADSSENCAGVNLVLTFTFTGESYAGI
jgi:hypothetical protein